MRDFTRRYYRKGPFPERAIRNKTLYYDRQNCKEEREITANSIRKHMRTRLQEERPELSSAEIERIIDRRMARGMRPYKG